MNGGTESMDLYLQPTYFIDSDHQVVIEFASNHTEPSQSPTEKAIALYYAVRDSIRYTANHINLEHKELKASTVLSREPAQAYCVEKSCVYAAVLRAVGIPSRLGFANVRNHIATGNLEEKLKTDVLVFHGFTELRLNGSWVKSTPVFNKELCDHLNVDPMEFDGLNDSIFQEFDKAGGKYMEYLHEYGSFHDVPHDMFVSELQRFYPHLFGLNIQDPTA